MNKVTIKILRGVGGLRRGHDVPIERDLAAFLSAAEEKSLALFNILDPTIRADLGGRIGEGFLEELIELAVHAFAAVPDMYSTEFVRGCPEMKMEDASVSLTFHARKMVIDIRNEVPGAEWPSPLKVVSNYADAGDEGRRWVFKGRYDPPPPPDPKDDMMQWRWMTDADGCTYLGRPDGSRALP